MPRKSIRDLTLKQKIGQTVIMRIEKIESQEEVERVVKYINDYSIGGLYFGFGIEVFDKVLDSTVNSFEKVLLTKAMELSEIKPIICADLDSSGYPFLMAIGATGSLELAYDYGKATALQARAAGMHLVFSPVVDLAGFMHMRCMSNDPGMAIPMLKEVLRGIRENGIATHVKHFPGVGPEINPDEWYSKRMKVLNSHMVTTRNEMSREEWYKKQGRIYKELLSEGVDSVMTAHESFPAFQKDDKRYGKYLPTTLSKEMTTGLLKEELGFKGVCLTDALIMGGFLGWYDSKAESEVQCLKAGTDMLLWPSKGYMDAVEKAILSGEIPEERLDDAVERIWKLKERFVFAKDKEAIDARFAEDFKQEMSRAVSKKSLTLIINEDNMIPVSIEKVSRILILTITEKDNFNEKVGVFADEFRSRGIEADICSEFSMESLENATGYDYIIYAIDMFNSNDLGSSSDQVVDHTWASLTHGREKSIVVSFGSPYHYAYFELAKVFINAYPTFGTKKTPDAFSDAAKAILGEIPFEGKLPIK